MTDKTIALPDFVKKTGLSQGVVCKRLRIAVDQGKAKGIKSGDSNRSRWTFPVTRVPQLIKLVQSMEPVKVDRSMAGNKPNIKKAAVAKTAKAAPKKAARKAK